MSPKYRWEYRMVHLTFAGDDGDQYEIAQIRFDDANPDARPKWSRDIDQPNGFSIEDLGDEVEDLVIKLRSALDEPAIPADELDLS